MVYFGITMEQAPAWLWKKYPDAQMQWETGQPFVDPTQYLLPNYGKPGPCWNHPGARSAGIRFVEAVGREIGQYNNILVWNVWQEVGYNFPSELGHLGMCYCPNTLAAFRTWLKTRYPSLETLNKSWRTSYADWNEVEPAHHFTKVPSQIDWGYFTQDVYLSEGLRWKADALRRSDPHKRPVLAHTGSPSLGGSADWRFARELDVYGSSNYPGWGEYQDPDITDAQRLLESSAVLQQVLDSALRWDYMRGASLNGEFWTAELQGGRAGGGVNPGRVPDPGDIRRWVLGALAGGVHGVCFWNHRSEPFWDEAYGFGLMELRGGETPRAKEAGRIGTAVNQRAAELLSQGVCPPASLAIVIDEDLWSFVNGSGEPLKTNFLSNLRGIHRALFQEGYPVDFLDAGDIAAKGGQYKVLIHPLPLALSAQAITDLRDYVHAGGTLISGPCPGRFDRFGFGTAGEMPQSLEQLFGVEHRQLLTLSGRQPHPSQSSLHPDAVSPLILAGADEFAGGSVRAEFFLQYLVTKSAKPILQYKQEVAGTANSFGSGRAILLGTLIGNSVGIAGAVENQSFLDSVLKANGIAPDRAGKLLRRRRRLGNKEAWFFFNLERAPVTEQVSLGSLKATSDLFGEPLQQQGGAVTTTVGPMDITCILLES
jgi:beta-galactosidase GanA